MDWRLILYLLILSSLKQPNRVPVCGGAAYLVLTSGADSGGSGIDGCDDLDSRV